jgi:hypothetical protein
VFGLLLSAGLPSRISANGGAVAQLGTRTLRFRARESLSKCTPPGEDSGGRFGRDTAPKLRQNCAETAPLRECRPRRPFLQVEVHPRGERGDDAPEVRLAGK